jgi:hypothetical protein
MMANTRKSKQKSSLQAYPRRQGGYEADDRLFPKPSPISNSELKSAIQRSFQRTLKTKSGEIRSPKITPEKLVSMCIKHLQERSDPILSPAFLSQCSAEEVFEIDAISYEMQRHRMKIGNFYQFLVIELMKTRFPNVYDGKREGDVEAEIEPACFKRGLRLYISVKKSGDTVGGQDIGGVIGRLETMAKEDKNLTRPFMGVVAIATPPKGVILSYEDSRDVRCKSDGAPYSPNCESWYPGFLYPYICGRDANEVYKEALRSVSDYFPFNTLIYRKESAQLLAEQLRTIGLVNKNTGKIDPEKYQNFIARKKSKDVSEVSHDK